MKNKVKILALVAVICEAFICLANMAIVVADSGSGGDLGSTCTHYCTSWGAGWHWQDLATFSSWSYDGAGGTGAPASKKASIVDRCSKYPEGTGVYRLSFERSNDRGASFVAGQFSGLVDVGRNVPYQSSIADDWGKTYQAFLAAEKAGATDTTWENTAWFCYNPIWEECDPETDPDCCGSCPEEASGTNYFWSKSKVEAVAGGDVPGGIEAKSSEDGSEYILFSSDQDTVQVKFTHYMGYTNGTTFNTPLHAGHPPNPNTTYGVTQTAEGSVSGTGAVSGVTFNGNAYGTAETQVETSTVTVNLQPGDKVKVCQKISYSPKNITYTGTRVRHGSWPYYYYYDWHYSWTGAGSGDSDVCATVTRPTEPGGGGPTAGSGGGSTSGDIMYAGEDSTVGWDVNGPNWDVRRLREWQAVVYRIPVEVPHNSRLYTGTGMPLYGNQPLNVCGWYSKWDYCNVLSDRAGSFGEEGQAHSYGPTARIVVPDTVGYKYCNSFGYRYEYWWYSSTSDWHLDKSYWYVYNAACRTIAKKPSTTIWNGSFMTAGGVKTSLSWRFDNAVMGIETAGAGGRSLYGSWSEFMSVVGGSNVGLTSGSILSRGHSQGNDEICDGSINNVALTIRNNSCSDLGHSQITNNTTYRTRLSTYLEDYGSSAWNKVSSIASINTSQTNVVNLDGDVTLSSNIELPSTTYDSIYKIPQVVIFINGNLKITSGVTRIDAWLIVSGDINTCSDFVSGSTQSEAVYRNMSTIYNRDTDCSRQLIFNGPVLARSLTARRSYGSDNLVSTPGTFGSNSGYGKWAAGEVFNFRADNFLWAYAQAGRYNSSYTESYSRELAPRY